MLVLLWIFYGPLLRLYNSAGLNIFDANFLGFLFGTIGLFLIFKIQKTDLSPLKIQDAKKALAYSVSLVSTNIFLFYAFISSTIANTIILHYTAILWSAIFALFFFKEKLTKWKIISFAVTLLAIGIIFFPEITLESKYLVGNIFALLSSFGYAGVIITSHSMKGIETKKAAFYSILFCTIVSAPFFALFKSQSSLEAFAGIFLLLGFYGIAEVLFLVYGMKKIEIITANLLLVLEIPGAAILGAVLYSEQPGMNTLAGGVLIIIATIILILKEKN